MKKFKKIMAVLVAAIMIVAMTVPAWASSTAGRLDGIDEAATGTITITNAEDGELYNVYKILDLYSFTDGNNATGNHTSDRYSYMIKDDSDWWDFVYDHSSNKAGVDTADKLFTIDMGNPVTNPAGLTGTYYFVKAFAGGALENTASTSVDENGRTEAIASSLNGSHNIQKFAKAALAYATHETTPGTPDVAPDASASKTATAASTPLGNLPLGYYLVSSSVGTLVTLDTNNLNINIIDKNEQPELQKRVRARAYQSVVRTTNKYPAAIAEDTMWVENADYEIGDTIKFRLKVKINAGAKNYVIHDVLEEGFDLVTTSFELYKNNSDGTVSSVARGEEDANWTVETSPTDGCGFEVVFKDKWLGTLTDDYAWYELEYTAKLNEEAVIFGEDETAEGDDTEIASSTDDTTTLIDGPNDSPVSVGQIPRLHNTDGKNTNSAVLTYGQDSGTAWAVATVDTFQFDFVKTQETATEGAYPVLEGAQFELYRAEKTKNGNNVLTAVGAATGSAVGLVKSGNTYRIPKSGEETTTIISTPDSGAVKITGLEAGTYYLKETKAPTGYNKIDGYHKIVIAPDNSDNQNTSTSVANAGMIGVQYLNGNTTPDVTDLYSVSTIARPATVLAGTTTTYNPTTAGQGGFNIVNKSGTELPSTGGMGTTVLYIVGGMLVILAGAYLFFSRKRTA